MYFVLTKEQTIKKENALNNGSICPDITDDPLVNYSIDCLLELTSGCEILEFDEGIYVEEAKHFALRND